MKIKTIFFFLTLGLNVIHGGCSTGYKNQQYAQLPNAKVFEEEYPKVWKGILAALNEYKLEEENFESGNVRTDWIYSTSTEKFVEYKVNDMPRKKYLQVRYKLEVKAEKHMGGVNVIVTPEEEVEALKKDGTFDSWKKSKKFDTSRANEVLRNIENKILSLPEA